MADTDFSQDDKLSALDHWEDEGGSTLSNTSQRDLNELLASEQRSIMSAEAATSPAAFNHHRMSSLDTRRLVNATAYPRHHAYIFAHERSGGSDERHNEFLSLIKQVEEKERLLAVRFSNGGLTAKAFNNHSRFLRQDGANAERLKP